MKALLWLLPICLVGCFAETGNDSIITPDAIQDAGAVIDSHAELGCPEGSIPQEDGGATAHPVVQPNGHIAEVIRCFYSAIDCYEVAGKLCPRGYDLLGATNPGLVYSALTVESKTRGTIVVECKGR